MNIFEDYIKSQIPLRYCFKAGLKAVADSFEAGRKRCNLEQVHYSKSQESFITHVTVTR